MKYPQQQFDLLVETLRELDKYYNFTKFDEITIADLNNLHWICYTEFNKGSQHNTLYITTDGKLIRKHQLDNNPEKYPNAKRIINPKDNIFELYPNDTNDDNIISAMKKAIKILKS